MIDHAEINAKIADAARWRALTDKGLAWLLGPPWRRFPLTRTGALLLRRWMGRKTDRPRHPAMAGLKLLPATSVSAHSGVSWSADGVYWTSVDVVAPSGVVKTSDSIHERAVAVVAGLYVGALPNPCTEVRATQNTDRRWLVTWLYSRVDQQAAPVEFNVYDDAGSGTIDLGTIVGTVAYDAEQYVYGWLSPQYAAGVSRRYVVRAVTAGGAESLMQEAGSPPSGLYESYSSAPPAHLCVGGTIVDAAPADAEELRFG